MHQILDMRLPGGGLGTVGSVPSPRDSGKWPRSWLNPKLSDSVTQEQLGRVVMVPTPAGKGCLGVRVTDVMEMRREDVVDQL